LLYFYLGDDPHVEWLYHGGAVGRQVLHLDVTKVVVVWILLETFVLLLLVVGGCIVHNQQDFPALPLHPTVQPANHFPEQKGSVPPLGGAIVVHWEIFR